MHPDSRAVFSSHVPGCQANMANRLCYSETRIFTQLTKSLWRLRVLHALCWVHQTSRLTGRQMHGFWKQSAFFLFFPSCAVNTPLDHCPLQPRAWSQSLTSKHSVCLCVECLSRWCLGRVKDGWEADSRDLDSCLGGWGILNEGTFWKRVW